MGSGREGKRNGPEVTNGAPYFDKFACSPVTIRSSSVKNDCIYFLSIFRKFTMTRSHYRRWGHVTFIVIAYRLLIWRWTLLTKIMTYFKLYLILESFWYSKPTLWQQSKIGVSICRSFPPMGESKFIFIETQHNLVG